MVLCTTLLTTIIRSPEHIPDEGRSQMLGCPFDGTKVADYTKDMQYVCVCVASVDCG